MEGLCFDDERSCVGDGRSLFRGWKVFVSGMEDLCFGDGRSLFRGWKIFVSGGKVLSQISSFFGKLHVAGREIVTHP